MLIEVHNVHARCVQATPEEADWLREYASIYTRGRGGRHKTVSLVDGDGEFPAGFCGFIRAEHQRLGTDPSAPSWRAGSRLRFADRRAPVGKVVDADTSWLYPFQREAVEAVLVAKRGVVKVPTGGGKCLGPDVHVMLYDGSSIPAGAVRVGMQLMGPDRKPRTVLSITRGQGPMFRIFPTVGHTWTCNDAHILVLAVKGSDLVIQMTMENYLASSRRDLEQFSATGLIEFDSSGRVHGDILRTPFKVESLGVGEYAGFELDGDRRFLLGDFTVTHNTEILSALVMRTSGVRWLMIAPRTQLTINAARRYLRRRIEADLRAAAHEQEDTAELEDYLRQLEAGEATNEVGPYRVGFVGDGTWDVRDTDTLVCATFQSLYASLGGRGGELLERSTGLLLDETHTAAAQTYNAVVDRAVHAYWRVGFSATPVSRTDGKNALVLGSTGRVIYEIKAQVLIDAGIFAKPTVVFLEHDTAPDVPASVECKSCKGKGITYEITLNMDIECAKCGAQGSMPPTYPVLVDSAIVKSKRRNARIIELAEIVETPVMIFVERKIHGRALQRALEKATDEKIAFIDQTSSTKVREQAVSDIERGGISYLVVSKVFREGVDAPNVRSVINASGGKSAIKILQQFGRGARVRKDKAAFAYYDFFDVGNDVLRRHSAARRNLIKREIGVEAKIQGAKQRELPLGKRRG